MLAFVPMTPPEYESWRKTSVADYAKENVASGRWTREEAVSRSEQEFRKFLPAGTSTPDNYLFSLLDDQLQTMVGVVWFAVVKEEGGRRHAFVYDFRIFEEYRRRGHGTQALLLLDELVRSKGLNSISLQVFAHNNGARDLYRKAGYKETNILMAKELT